MSLTNKQLAYNHIRDKLLNSMLAGGQRLSPAALAKELGISQIPVREALSQLHSEGLVIHEPHRGAFVRQLDRQELVDLIELRGLLECNAAAQAARRISEAELDELETYLGALRNLADEMAGVEGEKLLDVLSRWMIADLAFHMVILRVAGNRQVIRVIQDAHIMTQMFGYRTDYPEVHVDLHASYTKNFQVHRDVFLAIRRHDRKAAWRAMVVHQRRARRNMLARFDWLHQQPTADDPLLKEFPDSMREIVRNMEQGQPGEVPETKKNRKTKKPKREKS